MICRRIILVLVCVFFCVLGNAQALLSNDFTSVQIDSVANDSSANEGDIYRDYQTNSYYLGATNGSLISLSTQTNGVVLDRDGGNYPTSNNTFFDLPVNSSHIQTINPTLYTVIGDAEIRVAQQGLYMITGEISTSNMPSGSTKYILALYINGALRGYMSRGVATLPSNDFWGTTGVLIYQLQANDVVNVRYVINAGGSTLNARFTNIGIAKL